MLMKIWTTAIVLSAATSLVAWVCVAAHARGVHPLRAMARFAQKLSLAGVVVFGLMAAPLYRAGSTKIGGGTNNVPQMMPGPGNLDPMPLPGGGLQGLQGQAHLNPEQHPINQPIGGVNLNLSGFETITSTNTTRALTAEDFERGFAMARVGTGEEIDFTPLPNATIISDWCSFGAATDWVYAAFTNWVFRVGTNEVERLRVYSFGKIVPLVRDADGTIATNNWFAPFMASLGIVPQANLNWLNESDRPSQVWYAITPDNTLVVTWQNALLDRDTEKPISFQVEFCTDGRFAFRYDLSRLDSESAANFLAGASFYGNEWATNSLPTNVTSMAFYPLSESDAYDQDSDGDGLLTIDELFFYNTDPHNADTDYDGLNDGEELLAYNSDPIDPNSISAAYCDGFAAKLGGLDPFSCPEGSMNTVLEHIFYSGTTNGVFTYPTSMVDTAVLKIMVSGAGTGRLVVGDTVVPLIAPPPMRSGSVTNTLLLAVGKGVRKSLWWDKPDGLDLALRSDDLLIGRLPTWYLPHGWLAFPHTDATTPCIHDFYAKCRVVSLAHGEEFPGLTAIWTNSNADVEIENLPPVSAEIHGHFAKNQTRSISYTVDHPDRLNEEPVVFLQTLRFCPNIVEEDTPPGAEDEDFDSSEWPEQSETPDAEDTTSEEESATEYARIAALPLAQGVLQLYGSLGREDLVALSVPTGAPIRCCDCPDHWQSNYVAAAWMSHRLSAYDAADNHFDIAHEDVVVSLRGEYPSRDPYGDGVLFVTNGTPSFAKSYTILGVNIENLYGPALSEYASFNASFGFPITVNTNLDNATGLEFQSDVLLSNGVFKVAIEDATAPFEIWIGECWTWDDDLWESVYHPPLLLVDSASADGRHFTARQWRKLAHDRGYGRTLPFYVLSSSTGRCDLVFSYVFDQNGSAIRSAVRRRITSVNPPLLPDYDQDGAIGDADIADYLGCRTFRFWTNEDTAKGDYLGQNSDTTPNVADLVVNGRLDLVNLFPVKLDLKPFIDAWGSEATFILWESGNALRFCGTDMSVNNVWEHQTNDVYTTISDNIAGAELTPIGGEGAEIAPVDYLGNGNAPGVLVFEAADAVTAYNSPMLLVIVDDVAVYGFRLPMSITPAREMYGWINGRHLSGEAESRATVLNKTWGEEGVKSLVFLHGANVSEADAEKWGDALFKRLFLSGAHVNFYNVDWRSDIGSNANYHENASNAFVVASQLVAEITNSIPSEKVVMAHSLGNLVVSSMMQDYGLQVSKYIMCNSAVPAEAYDMSLSPTNVLVHKDWNEYPRKSFANEWYKCFEEDVGDDRYELSWGGRFADVADYAVNFYSTGDHVLELYDNNNVWPTDGYENWSQMFERYSWHKQELWKGRKGLIFNMGTTDWAGWSIRENSLGYNMIQPTNAWLMSGVELKTNTVFKLQPESMNTNSIPLLLRGAHLAKGIPSRTPASGAMKWGPPNMDRRMINLESTDENANGLQRPNGWVVRSNGWFSDWGNRWLHSDIKDVSYFFVFKFYQRLKEEGALQ